MPNEEHLNLLKQGVAQWNKWRWRYQEIQPRLNDANLNDANLNGADLHGTDLHGADLSRTSLVRTNLSHANLNGANLIGANLSSANLNHANLDRSDLSAANLSFAYASHTNLSNAKLNTAKLVGAALNGANLNTADLTTANLLGAYLSLADLSHANLSHADLSGTDLLGVNLNGANLRGVTAYRTIFASTDLRTVKGLAKINHQGPSRVELHTVQLPQDGSAIHFLRGAGVPDEWIDDYHIRMMHPIQYHSCFISYAHQDDDLARRLHADLQDKGVRCWFAPHDMRTGDKIRPRVDEAIHLQDKLLLILSEHSVNSDWVEHEVETALAREHRDKRTILFSIRMDNAILEHEYTGWTALVHNERHIGDFTGWKDHGRYQAAFERMMRDLKKAAE